jgi:hypothetical protein
MSSSHLNPLNLSEEAVLLLAADLASVSQLSALRALISGYPKTLHLAVVLELLLRILPETTPPEDYVSIVYTSYCGQAEDFNALRIPRSYIDGVSQLSRNELSRRLDDFDLSTPPKSPTNADAARDLLTQWFFQRARRVEESTGMIDLARRLVLPSNPIFAGPSTFPPVAVTTWGTGVLQVLETFIFDNDDEDDLQLLSFENLEPGSAVRLLLSRTTPETVSRNIRDLIEPFVHYVHFRDPQKEIWNTVWEWLLDRAMAGELTFISNLVSDCVDIEDDRLERFLRTCLASCYLCHQSSPTIRADLHRIHQNVSRLWQRFDVNASDNEIILQYPETALLASELRTFSPLTMLTKSALRFLDQMINSADIVAQASIPPELSIRDLCLIRNGSQQMQLGLVDRLLRSEQNWTKRNEEQWRRLRHSLRSLHSQSRVLGKLSEETIDAMILASLLDASGTLFEIADL